MEQTVENQKKPMGRKIGSIVLLCVAAVLVVAMVLSYFIPKNFAPAVAEPDYVEVYTSTSQGKTYNKGSEVYNKIMALHNDSFKVTIMDALLTGNIAESGEYVEKHSNPRSSNTNYIKFGYNETKTIGSAYHGSYPSYDAIIVVVAETNQLTSTNVYFMSTPTASWVNYQTYAHQSALYNYILSL